MAEEKKVETKPKSSWGGKREGAGTKVSAQTILTMKEKRQFFHKLLAEEGDFEGILRSLFRSAKKNPKVAAYVVDQAMGKSIQGIELAGKDGGPIDFRNQSDDELRKLAAARIASAVSASGIGEAGAGEATPA